MSLNLGNWVDLIDPFMENCLIKIDFDTLYDLVFHELYDSAKIVMTTSSIVIISFETFKFHR